MVEHSFNIGIAQKYCIPAAILYRHFQFWIAKNLANRVNFHDGRTWSYNTLRALTDQFPYLSVWDIRGALKLLVERGILLKGNFNKHSYDRTIWYAFKDEKTALKGLPSHLWNSQMEPKKSANAFVDSTDANGKIHTTIPIPIPIKDTDNNSVDSLSETMLGLELEEKLRRRAAEYELKIHMILPARNPGERTTYNRIREHLIDLILNGQQDERVFDRVVQWAREAVNIDGNPRAIWNAKCQKELGFKGKGKKLLKI